MNQSAAGFTASAVVRQLDCAHSFDDGQPKITEGGKRFDGRHRLVLHLPNDRQLSEGTGATLPSHKSVGETDQFEETVLPGGDTDFDVDPRIRFRGETLGSHTVRFSTGFFCALRNAAHDPAVAAAANCESGFRQSATKGARFFIVGFVFPVARTAEHSNDSFPGHGSSLNVMR